MENNLRKYRKQRNLTLEDIGNKTGLTKSSISKIENGLQGMYVDTAMKIADVLNVSLDDLCAREYINEETTIIKVREFDIRDIYNKLTSMTENELISLRGAIDFVLETKGNNSNLLKVRDKVDSQLK